MRDIKTIFILFLLLAVGSTAEAYTWTYLPSKANFTNIKGETVTLEDGAIWTTTFTGGNGATIEYDKSTSSIRFGIGSNHFDSAVFSSSSISGIINSITIRTQCVLLNRKKECDSLAVTVGTVNYKVKGKTDTIVSLGTSMTSYTFTGSSSGKIQIKYKSMDVRFNLQSISVDFSCTPKANISSAGWATYCTPCPINFDGSGIEAYSVKLSSDNSSVALNKVTGTVATFTPVLINGASKLYTLEGDSTNKGTTIDSDLKASDGTKTTTDSTTVYVLSNKKSRGVGFYKLGEGVLIPAGRCYLEVPISPSSAKEAFTLDETATAISRPALDEPSADNAPRYNLAGQRVGNDYRGLVIVKGKKVVIR